MTFDQTKVTPITTNPLHCGHCGRELKPFERVFTHPCGDWFNAPPGMAIICEQCSYAFGKKEAETADAEGTIDWTPDRPDSDHSGRGFVW